MAFNADDIFYFSVRCSYQVCFETADVIIVMFSGMLPPQESIIWLPSAETFYVDYCSDL